MQQQQLNQSQKEQQFFESLGLPGDLNNLQHYQFEGQAIVNQQQHQRQDNKSPSTRAPEAAAKEILTLTIEIGEGRNENILICEGDDPFQLAHEFD